MYDFQCQDTSILLWELSNEKFRQHYFRKKMYFLFRYTKTLKRTDTKSSKNAKYFYLYLNLREKLQKIFRLFRKIASFEKHLETFEKQRFVSVM